MNPRSMRFRLAAYQVCLLAGVLLAFSLAAFWGLRRHLTHSVEAQCANLTRQIAESHGGTIHVESHPGEGATFVLQLPVGQQPEAGKEEAQPARS